MITMAKGQISFDAEDFLEGQRGCRKITKGEIERLLRVEECSLDFLDYLGGDYDERGLLLYARRLRNAILSGHE
jgi:hypothetical protein